MIELTKDDKALILISSFVSNPMTASVPSEILALGLQQMLNTRNIDFSLLKVTEYIMIVKHEQQLFIQDGFSKLQNMSKGFM